MYDLIWRLKAAKGTPYAERFALHFFLFYDAGEAAKCAEATNGYRNSNSFWDYCDETYSTARRGTERRHFRGQNGRMALTNLSKKGTPAMVLDSLWSPSYTMMADVIQRNFAGCQIGPYFMWKIMDILDRGLGSPVRLTRDEAVKHMPDAPRKCAKDVWPNLPLWATMEIVMESIRDLPAPGSPDRGCSYAEAETVLCMIKGYFLTKTHVIGDDVDEKHRQLAAFPNLCALLPPKLDWSQYARGELEPTTVSA